MLLRVPFLLGFILVACRATSQNKLASRIDSLHKIVKGKQEEQAKLTSKLQEQVEQQQVTITELLDRLDQIEVLSSGYHGNAVAFSAEVSSILRALGPKETIVFGTVRTNDGGAYSGKTGVFTCPVSGLYLFSATVLSDWGGTIETELILRKANKHQTIMAKLYSGVSSAGAFGSGSKTVILRLHVGDQVWVRASLGSVVWHSWSSFSGVLLKASQNKDQSPAT